jgi:hypothetical protein
MAEPVLQCTLKDKLSFERDCSVVQHQRTLRYDKFGGRKCLGVDISLRAWPVLRGTAAAGAELWNNHVCYESVIWVFSICSQSNRAC